MRRARSDGYRRRSARILLVDASDRLLLFRFRHREAPGHCWITPGGGVGAREGLAEAAARELREETGLAVAPGELGAPVATTSGYADLGWARGRFRDDFFLYRTRAHEVDTGGQEAFEREHMLGHRWWTVDELAATGDPVFPLELAPLLADLLKGDVPDEPVRLPWHH
ncbi:NUDIX domain-containing protein [Spirillospora sp. NPDC029432]|uniref:NUDIX hydrolase n=1 Tax=Spirillospora sp. NPDC029432 TaxID=3154599 RepID=UPI0034516AAA